MKIKDTIVVLLLVITMPFLKACNDNSNNSYGVNNSSDSTMNPKKDTIVSSPKIKKNTRKKKKNNTEPYYNSYNTPAPVAKKNTKIYSSSNQCNSRQCLGSTKKGGRCRNMTTNCSGYCWRHGG